MTMSYSCVENVDSVSVPKSKKKQTKIMNFLEVIYLDSSQLLNCLAQFHCVI